MASNTIMADGGGTTKKKTTTVNKPTTPTTKKTTQPAPKTPIATAVKTVGNALAAKSGGVSNTMLVTQQAGPAIPGLSNNASYLNSASGKNTTPTSSKPISTAVKTIGNDGYGEIPVASAGPKGSASQYQPGSNLSTVNNVPVQMGGVIKPQLLTGKGLADRLGIVYDRGAIEKAYTDAANTRYANLDNEFGRTQDAYYDSGRSIVTGKQIGRAHV